MGTKQTFILHDKPVTGIDISPTGIKLMSINTKKWSVVGYGSVDLDPAKAQDSLSGKSSYFAESLKRLLDKHLCGHLPSDHVVLSVPTARTYSRSITLPRGAEHSLLDAVRLEAEQYIPIPLGELNIGYEIIERTNESIVVSVAAAPRTLVNNIVSACDTVGLRAIMVEPAINAVARITDRTEEGHLASVLVDIGAATTDIAILDKTIRASASVNDGGNTFTLRIADKMKVSLENAHQLKVLSGLNYGPKQAKIRAALKPSLDNIVVEIQKIMRYYSERIDSNKKIYQVIIVGGGSNVPGIGDYFTEHLVMPARVASPWQLLDFGKLPQPARQFKPRYITAAGLACVDPREIWK